MAMPVKPGGKEPEVMDPVYGGPTPPETVMLCEYATPTVPPGSVVGDSTIGGAGAAIETV
jgi:hypothetical protein